MARKEGDGNAPLAGRRSRTAAKRKRAKAASRNEAVDRARVHVPTAQVIQVALCCRGSWGDILPEAAARLATARALPRAPTAVRAAPARRLRAALAVRRPAAHPAGRHPQADRPAVQPAELESVCQAPGQFRPGACRCFCLRVKLL